MERASRKFTLGPRLTSALIGTILISGGVLALSVILSQRFPEVTLAPGLSTLCADPASLSANVTLIVGGTDGYVRYTCGSAAAFSALAGAIATPTYNLTGVVFTAIYIFKHSTPAGTTCANGEAATPLSTGSSVRFPGGGDTSWDYCARYVAAPLDAATTFTLTWSA